MSVPTDSTPPTTGTPTTTQPTSTDRNTMDEKSLMLVTGATGYIGTRLVPELLAAGHRVRVLSRSAAKLEDRPWLADVEVIEGDATEHADLIAALDGVRVAYYLLHSMDGKGDFQQRDRDLARRFADAAAEQDVARIVYLGGLHPDGEKLSDHLASRVEVGQILLDGKVPAAVLQAAVIVGTGSASFEMLRHLTERLPAMVAPRWLRNRIQPIAVRDVLHYLVGAAELPADLNRTLDIGGPEVLTYDEMIQRFATLSGLRRRLIVTVPVLTPKLAGHWVGLVTPVPAGLAKPLVDSLVHEVVCREDDIRELIPEAEPLLDFEQSMHAALADAGSLDDPGSPAADQHDPARAVAGDPDWVGEPHYTDRRSSTTTRSPTDMWATVAAIGGDTGWYGTDVLWQVRGAMDRVIGGPGMDRGRPNRALRPGDEVDNWVVEAVDAPRSLTLRARTKLPGTAWLRFEVDSVDPEDADAGRTTRLTQVSTFRPSGLSGHLYWNVIAPAHRLVFGRMHRGMLADTPRH